MKIVLRSDVETLGKKGDIVEVRDGYARNFLVPRGLAIVANRGIVKQAEAMRRSREARDAREREAANAVASQLATGSVKIPARVGEGGKLFGSVTSTEVAAAVLGQMGLELDRRKIELDDPLKEVGAVEVTVRLHPDVSAQVRVEVIPAD